mmetsp:Transcript_31452/g.77107  ORF Transcript_31452/g.77107 Transcript_31452/m.77107 type:complete len:355 (-) Transcript_31452:54-1118(-)
MPFMSDIWLLCSLRISNLSHRLSPAMDVMQLEEMSSSFSQAVASMPTREVIWLKDRSRFSICAAIPKPSIFVRLLQLASRCVRDTSASRLESFFRRLLLMRRTLSFLCTDSHPFSMVSILFACTLRSSSAAFFETPDSDQMRLYPSRSSLSCARESRPSTIRILLPCRFSTRSCGQGLRHAMHEMQELSKSRLISFSGGKPAALAALTTMSSVMAVEPWSSSSSSDHFFLTPPPRRGGGLLGRASCASEPCDALLGALSPPALIKSVRRGSPGRGAPAGGACLVVDAIRGDPETMVPRCSLPAGGLAAPRCSPAGGLSLTTPPRSLRAGSASWLTPRGWRLPSFAMALGPESWT